MFEIIINKAFLDNFFVICNKEYDTHKMILQILKKLKKCKIITDYESIDAFKQSAKDNPLIDYLLEIRIPEIEFNANIEKLINTEAFFNSGSPFKLFLVDEIDSKDIESYGFELNTSSEINDSFKKFIDIEGSHRLKVRKGDIPIERRFDSWECLERYNHACHSIVICDRYILTNIKDQKIKNNLVPLLEQLCKNPTKRIEIFISTEKISENIVNVYSVLEQHIKKIKPSIDFHLSLIIKPPNSKIEHFRSIYTNYFQYHPDNSFNFFKDNGALNDKNTKLEIKFVFNPSDAEFIEIELSDIAKYTRNVQNRPAIGSDTEKVYYFENKNNRILNYFKGD